MNLSRYYFGFYVISSSCNLVRVTVHARGLLLSWHMSFMDRAHLGSWYASLCLGISLEVIEYGMEAMMMVIILAQILMVIFG